MLIKKHIEAIVDDNDRNKKIATQAINDLYGKYQGKYRTFHISPNADHIHGHTLQGLLSAAGFTVKHCSKKQLQLLYWFGYDNIYNDMLTLVKKMEI